MLTYADVCWRMQVLREAARVVGVRHALLMLAHSSFVDVLDQAAPYYTLYYYASTLLLR